MAQKTDRRVSRSQRAIQNAFYDMLLDIGFDSITVKDLTIRADISRKTFYLHYVDKFDLLNTIVNMQLDELQVICNQKKEKDFVEGTIIWFQYFEQRKEFFAALFSTESTVIFRHRLLDFIMEQLRMKLDAAQSGWNTEVLRKFMGTAVLGVVESYVLGQFHTGVEEIARQVGVLLEQLIQSANERGAGAPVRQS